MATISPDVTQSLAAVAIAGALLCATVGCDEAPEEPAGGEPAATASPNVPSALEWTAPASWTLDKRSKAGRYRAKYTVPQAGKAETDAEMLVQRLGVGTGGKLKKELADWLDRFEGPGTEKVKRETMERDGIEVEVVSLDATYKYPMGPRIEGQAAATVLKEEWAGLAAAVKTPEKGNWFFSIVGPRETVRAAEADFREMIGGLK